MEVLFRSTKLITHLKQLTFEETCNRGSLGFFPSNIFIVGLTSPPKYCIVSTLYSARIMRGVTRSLVD